MAKIPRQALPIAISSRVVLVDDEPAPDLTPAELEALRERMAEIEAAIFAELLCPPAPPATQPFSPCLNCPRRQIVGICSCHF